MRRLTLLLVVGLLAAACSDSADTTTTTAAAEATTATTQSPAATEPPATTLPPPTTQAPTAPTLTWTAGSECVYSGPDTFPKGGEIVKFTYRNESSELVALYVSPGPGEALSRREVDPDTELTNTVIFRDAGDLALLCEPGDGQFVEGGLITVEETTASTQPEGESSLQSDLGEFSSFGAGTYTMGELGTPVTFTVSEEWSTQPVGPGYFVITTPDSAGPGDHDLVFLRPAALFSAGGEPVGAADDLDGWLATVPDTASVSEPTQTTVAGLDAVTFEVTVETDLPLLLAGAEGAEFFKGFSPGFLYEVFWIDHPDGPIVVVNGTPEDDPAWLDVARGVIATLEIG